MSKTAMTSALDRFPLRSSAAPANDLIGITIVMTREEWRAIEDRHQWPPSSSPIRYDSVYRSASDKITRAIRKKA